MACCFFCQIFFSDKFSSIKRLKFLIFFPNRFEILHCSLRFLTMKLSFHERICRIRLSSTERHWEGSNWMELKFLLTENFSPAGPRRKQLKIRVFSGGQSYFVALLWPNIPCMISQWWFGHEKWGVSCIHFLVRNFRFFSQDFGKKVLEKSPPLKVCILWSLAHSACLLVMHIT